MKKHLLILCLVLFSFSIYSQNKYWGKASADKVNLLPKVERGSTPSKYKLVSLNLIKIKAELKSAPRAAVGVESNVIVSFPNPNGGFNKFKIYNNPVTDESYTKSHPDVNSYSGQDIENPTTSIRFSVTIFGFHAMIFSNEGTYYIDPYTKDLNIYIVYFKKNVTTNIEFGCSTKSVGDINNFPNNFSVNNSSKMSDGNYRTYRLAVSTTKEYSLYQINAANLNNGTDAEKKDAVYQAMVVGLVRINGIYERELSVHFSLVYNTDIIYIASGDPYANSDADINNVGDVLNISSVDNNYHPVGVANYDIGHVFTTHSGLAGLGVVCDDLEKSRGTTGGASPVGDPFFVDFVAHEFGHQFGARHTFSGTGGNCNSGTISNNTAVEPGSGTTIMAYAGICSPVDVQPHSDDYFHAISLAEIQTYILTTNCAVSNPNGNSAPVVNAGADFTIPISTPFLLTGSATDANNDVLTYCWEQIDYSGADGSPYFRSFSPLSSSTRYFPSLNYVFQGNLTSTWEQSPTYSRNMNFALTARDNRLSPIGGQIGRDDMKIIVDETKGPLTVTSQNIVGITYPTGSLQTVTWNVNNTNTLPGGNTVDILLTTDNGATWTTLLANTTNDGLNLVILPNTPAQKCRIMVKASGNIFFNVNLNDFSIGYQMLNNCVTITNNTAFSVPDGIVSDGTAVGQEANSFINIPNSGTITDVNAFVSGENINGGISEFLVKLTHPNNTTSSTLWDNYCSNSFQSNFDVNFDDSAQFSISSNCSSDPTGDYIPKTALNVFNNLPSEGNWKLSAYDYFNGGNTGQIKNWSVTICYNYYQLLKNDSFGLESFSIYPNPNNGEFNVKFNSNSSISINIFVHDIRGREVFNNTYNNNGVFQQTINLVGIQAGIYLVTVVDGNKKEVRKIVIE